MKRNWIRTVYLYMLALLGVILLTIGGVRLMDMALKAFIFTEADQQQRIAMRQPPMPYGLQRVEDLANDEDLQPAERAAIQEWLADYDRWKEESDAVDPMISSRQRTASSSLAMILIGLPLYFYHWRLIRRENADSPP
ncbi:MAG TPA: hypothetical protein VFI91_07015 [Longimicrobiaceae bacterium]|nr:hypothetical protein [Longimicrobiaceae bacterium]